MIINKGSLLFLSLFLQDHSDQTDGRGKCESKVSLEFCVCASVCACIFWDGSYAEHYCLY